uniref:Uncharacterized protein n=1 Tax=Anguilla anguilla TaxID=7936 RepID=A0A0E9XPU8_ANGAN
MPFTPLSLDKSWPKELSLANTALRYLASSSRSSTLLFKCSFSCLRFRFSAAKEVTLFSNPFTYSFFLRRFIRAAMAFLLIRTGKLFLHAGDLTAPREEFERVSLTP